MPTTLGAQPVGTERVDKCGGGSPAGAVSRRDDPRRDEVGEVAHGRFDAVFDGRAREVVAAEQEVDRLVGEEPPCFEARR